MLVVSALAGELFPLVGESPRLVGGSFALDGESFALVGDIIAPSSDIPTFPIYSIWFSISLRLREISVRGSSRVTYRSTYPKTFCL